MVEYKTIGIMTLILSGIIGAGAIGANFFDKPQYYCESRTDIGVKSCDTLTKYGVDNGKCTVSGTGFICKTGWVKIVDDRVITPPVVINNEFPAQYKCDIEECVRV